MLSTPFISLSLIAFGLCLSVVPANGAVMRSEKKKQSVLAGVEVSSSGSAKQLRTAQSMHWVFTTDCSAEMFNQGNLLLSSADAVGQQGKFTWIMNGCETEQQTTELKQLGHPDATVYFAPATEGNKHVFQASNRPVSLLAWWKATMPQEDAIAVIDPDMTFLRPVSLVSDPANSLPHRGPWEAPMVQKGHGVGAKYGQGCQSNKFNESQMFEICGAEGGASCFERSKDYQKCTNSYSSGPPWIMHHSDAEKLLEVFPRTMFNLHRVWADLLTEQVAYGMAQMQVGVDNTLDPFWFISNPSSGEQPWSTVAELDWDPCQARAAPPKELGLPPFWHACSAYSIPHLKDQGFSLHKDHVHKDILDCDAPLLRYAPKDALERYKVKLDKGSPSKDFANAWGLCTYTNVLNAYATSYKSKFCKSPNLNASFAYPNHGMQFLNQDSHLKKVFRGGGWADNAYKKDISNKNA